MIDIAYEDDNVIVVNKPAGVASQSEKGFEKDLMSMVLTYLKAARVPASTAAPSGETAGAGKSAPSGEPYLAIINRLDKPVAGLVLYAKNRKAAGILSAKSGDHAIGKYYLAVCKGHFDENKGELEDYLAKDAKNNISRVVSENAPGAKRALLTYEVLEERTIGSGNAEEAQIYSLLMIRLITGRHHQIRVQMASRGHALYGDNKYNPDFAGPGRNGTSRITPALYAYRMDFINVGGSDRISVDVKPSGDVWDTLKSCGFSV